MKIVATSVSALGASIEYINGAGETVTVYGKTIGEIRDFVQPPVETETESESNGKTLDSPSDDGEEEGGNGEENKTAE